MISRNNPVFSASGLSVGVPAIAVPTERLRDRDLPTNSREETLVIPPGASKVAISIIDKDIELMGSSVRQFRLNRLLSDDERARLLSTVVSNPVAIVGGPSPEYFHFIQFQGADAGCVALDKWSFDTEKIINIMRFNQKIRERLKLDVPRRLRILIVYTGFGKPLALDPAFHAILFADIS